MLIEMRDCPVVVYPDDVLEEIARIVEEHRHSPSKVYNSVEDMFSALGIDL